MDVLTWMVFCSLFGVGLCVYWIPTLVAYLRKSTRLVQIAIVNGFLGWTYVGWVVALVIALEKENQ